MRDRIAYPLARALLWALSLLIPYRRPGRHSAAHLTDMAGELPPATPTAIPHRSPWLEPWPTPTPAHIRELYEPLRGEDVALTRPYVLAENTANLRTVCERRKALAFAEAGEDYPYTYDGALPSPTDHTPAATAPRAVPA